MHGNMNVKLLHFSVGGVLWQSLRLQLFIELVLKNVKVILLHNLSIGLFIAIALGWPLSVII